jgi:hypothetical protein
VAAGLVALVCAAGIATLTFVDVEPIASVEVAGARHVTVDTVRQATGLMGVPLFRASASDARSALLAISAVRDARVDLGLPTSARVTLTEREAAGRWVVGTAEWFVDAEGVLFASSDTTAAPDLRVRDDRAAARHPGERIDPVLVATALRLAKIGPGELRADATAPSVRVEAGPKGIVLDSGGGWEVRFGDPDRIEEKLELLRRFLRDDPGRRLEYVDVRSKDQIVFCPDRTPTCPG